MNQYPVDMNWETFGYRCKIVSKSMKSGYLTHDGEIDTEYTWISHQVEWVSKRFPSQSFRKEMSFKKLRKELKRANINVVGEVPNHFDNGLFEI